MFLDNIKKFRRGRKVEKVVFVLLKTYDLSVEDEFNLSRIDRIVQNFDEVGTYDEQSAAVLFLTQLVKHSDPSNERQKELAIKYILRAKGAHKRGILTSDYMLNNLFDKAKSVFNIEADSLTDA